tara:strand:- start:2106 stop:2450 length:345 start_codon:yes stop_codon:yes gene_type:complete
MKNRPTAPFIVSAMTLLATSLGVADASAKDGRKFDRKDDSTVTAGKGNHLTPRTAESRQLKMESPDAPQLQSRQLKMQNPDAPQLQSRQLKMQNPDAPELQSRQIKKGPPDDGG